MMYRGHLAPVADVSIHRVRSPDQPIAAIFFAPSLVISAAWAEESTGLRMIEALGSSKHGKSGAYHAPSLQGDGSSHVTGMRIIIPGMGNLDWRKCITLYNHISPHSHPQFLHFGLLNHVKSSCMLWFIHVNSTVKPYQWFPAALIFRHTHMIHIQHRPC